MESSPSRQRLTANKLVEAYGAMDVDTISTLRDPSCQRIILPKSLNLAPTSNEAFNRHLKQLLPIFSNFRLTVNDVVEDLPSRKIVMYVTAQADTAAGEYNNEYVWFMEFDEAGDRLVGWKEFVDVGVNRDFWPKLHAAKTKAQAAAAT